MAKWITIEGREHPLLIHGTYDLEVGDRVTVFPLKGDKISAATAKGLPIEPGARVVVVPHERYPGSQIYRSIFGNDEMAPHIHIGNIGEYQIIFVDEYADFHAEITSNPPLQSQTWNFGDWQSGSLNTSWDANPSHQYRHPGWYNVRLTARNQHLSDTVTWESAVRVEVPPPTSLSATVNDGPGGGIDLRWTPGIPSNYCIVVRRPDMYPPHPNNGTLVYSGQNTGIYDYPAGPMGSRYYYRVWNVFEGVRSEGYRDQSIKLSPGSGSLLNWGLFSYSRSSGNGEYGGALVGSDYTPQGHTGGVSMELYFEKNHYGTPSWCRAKATISGTYSRISGWLGIYISDNSAGGARIRVNGEVVLHITEAEYSSGGYGSVGGMDFNIPLRGGTPISGFTLEFERYHTASFRTRFSAFLYDIRLT